MTNQFEQNVVSWNIPKTYPDYVLHKMVTVMRHGEEVKISKRAGSYVTVRDLVEWSGGVHSEMTPEEREKSRQALRKIGEELGFTGKKLKKYQLTRSGLNEYKRSTGKDYVVPEGTEIIEDE